MIYYSEFSKTNKRCEQRAYQRLFGNNDLFDRYRNKVDDAFFFATVSALADEYKRDSDDDEEITKARENVERRFGPLFDASLIEDLLHYYDMYRP